ncbi:MAG TPA: hypothetical protein VF713_22385 [Thermoanaerobaculia bacterium]
MCCCAGAEEGDLQPPFAYFVVFPYELVQPPFLQTTVPVPIDVIRFTRNLAVEEYTEDRRT